MDACKKEFWIIKICLNINSRFNYTENIPISPKPLKDLCPSRYRRNGYILCVLIDIGQVQYSNLGKDLTKRPVQRQIGSVQLRLTIANMRLTNTSGQAPRRQKEEAWAIWTLIEQIHQKLHGSVPLPNVSPLIRISQQRTLRDDGLQEYEVYYSCQVQNI